LPFIALLIYCCYNEAEKRIARETGNNRRFQAIAVWIAVGNDPCRQKGGGTARLDQN
jgi:hypothetical protein